jgi:hypothetical protein
VGVPTACLTCLDFSARAHRPVLSSFSSSVNSAPSVSNRGLGEHQQVTISPFQDPDGLTLLLGSSSHASRKKMEVKVWFASAKVKGQLVRGEESKAAHVTPNAPP